MLFSFATLSLCLFCFLCSKSLLSFQSFIYHFPWRFRSEVASVWPSIPLLNSWLPRLICTTWVRDLIMLCSVCLPCLMCESIVVRDGLTHPTFSKGNQESVIINVSVFSFWAPKCWPALQSHVARCRKWLAISNPSGILEHRALVSDMVSRIASIPFHPSSLPTSLEGSWWYHLL